MGRRLAAMMFLDLEGRLSLAQQDEVAAVQLLQEQEKFIRPVLESHRGHRVRRIADGLLIEFQGAVDAVECAVAIQRSVRERPAVEGETPPRFRIGIHVGTVERRGVGTLGDAVEIAARIQSLAEPGGICLSEPAYVQAHNHVPYRLLRRGPTSLDERRDTIALYRVALPWQDGPSPSTAEPPRPMIEAGGLSGPGR